MADEVKPADTIVQPTPVAAVTAKETSVAVAPATGEPEFLKDRLDRERRSILKDLGIKLKRDEDPNERLEEYKTELASDRTENKDLKKKLSAHEDTIQKLAQSSAAVKVFADMEFGALTEAQKSIVVASAGDDPNERLKTIAIMKAAGATITLPAAALSPITAPAQTAPAVSSPVPGTSQAVDVRAEYVRLQQYNPLEAAAFLLQNRYAYFPQK